VLCSSSRRTVETLAGIAPQGEQLIEPELYGASAQALVERLRLVPPDLPSVMVIGHNPAMQVLVLRLATRDGAHFDEVERKFPTGALATLSFECAWSELGPGCAELADFVRPKALRRT
jgi:phosphohistidine phosphatase